MKCAEKFLTLILMISVSIGVKSQNKSQRDDGLYTKILDAFIEKEKIRGSAIILQRESIGLDSLRINPNWPESIKAIIPRFYNLPKTPAIFTDRIILKRKKVFDVPESEIKAIYLDRDNAQHHVEQNYPGVKSIVFISQLMLAENGEFGIVYVVTSLINGFSSGYAIVFSTRQKKIICFLNRQWTS